MIHAHTIKGASVPVLLLLLHEMLPWASSYGCQIFRTSKPPVGDAGVHPAGRQGDAGGHPPGSSRLRQTENKQQGRLYYIDTAARALKYEQMGKI